MQKISSTGGRGANAKPLTKLHSRKKPIRRKRSIPPVEEPELSSRISAETSAEEFDVSSLPSIDSIGAGTDITAFMRPGVPSALRHAALRRVWAADPAIRNFVGLNENYWNDVAGAAAAPGFGDLDPGVDVERMVSESVRRLGSEKVRGRASNDFINSRSRFRAGSGRDRQEVPAQTRTRMQ